MAAVPESVAEFLRGKRFAVAGVSRTGRGSAANAVFAKLRDCGYEVFPVNPNASEVEGAACYPNVASIPAELDGVVVVTHPSVSADIVQQAAERGVPRVWLHRSFQGSVSAAAVQACRKAHIVCIVGGCPLMYCEPVDPGHKWMCKVLGWFGRVPRPCGDRASSWTASAAPRRGRVDPSQPRRGRIEEAVNGEHS